MFEWRVEGPDGWSDWQPLREELTPQVGIDAVPHPDNARRCICGRPIYWTGTAWRDRTTNASHPAPLPRPPHRF